MRGDAVTVKTVIVGLILGVWLGAASLFAYTPAEQVRHLNKCVGCYLRNANFANHDLTGANLRGANLQYANFQKATLYNADLSGADLHGADFTGALWIDGETICKRGSIGQCLAKEKWLPSDEAASSNHDPSP